MMMVIDNLRHVLDQHELWLQGKGGRRAGLPGADLSGANLSGADLAGADLSGADLSGADLYGASLVGAKLIGAICTRAYLVDANLVSANFVRADLVGANLARADLAGANLTRACLADTYLVDANLVGARLPHFQIPGGELVAWKKVEYCIVELRIPHTARRTGSLIGRKCRAEFAFVRLIEGGGPVTSRGVTYREGEVVRPDSYDDDPRVECTHGIHFFLTREEAEEWI